VELSEKIRQLTDDDELRARMGEVGREHMAEQRSSEATAHAYASAIESTIEVARDPVLPAMERWARALDDVGVRERHVRAGYGVRHAEALESFKRSS
jgi:hypothetical protein